MPHSNSQRGLTLAISTRRRSPELGRYLRHLRQRSGLSRVEIQICVNPGRWSLSQVYNQFLKQASFPIVCLLHDDLGFARNSHWGRQIVQAFARHPDTAVISAAGSISLQEHGVYWLPREEMLGQVCHHLKPAHKHGVISKYSEAPAPLLPALVLDGLLLAVHRERLGTQFDERLSGFHFYDIAFSLSQSLAAQRNEGGRCQVLPRLGIQHKSVGKPTPAFEAARQQFLQYYASVLPCRLRPDLLLNPLPQQPVQASVEVLIRHSRAGLPLSTALERLGPDARQIAIFNSSGLSPDTCLQGLPNRGQVLKSQVEFIPVSPSAGWAELNPLLLNWLQRQSSAQACEYLLLLDSAILPLQRWLPALLQRFRQYPGLGTLGLRLHYPDTHLLHHNGLSLWKDRDLYDIHHRGIHSPFRYRNTLEWDCLGTPATALLLRRQDFLDWGGLGQQNWIPGLELNLEALRAGRRNAVDSRLVGYWHETEVEPDKREYQNFLVYFQHWMQAYGRGPEIQARVQSL